MRVFSKSDTTKLVNSFGKSKYMELVRDAAILKQGQSLGIELGKDKLSNGEIVTCVALDSVKRLIKDLNLPLRVFTRVSFRHKGITKSRNVIMIIEKRLSLNSKSAYPTHNRFELIKN